MAKSIQPLDPDNLGRVGERVFYRSTSAPARAAIIANVDVERGPCDLVVFCSGYSDKAREAWACGHNVVTFRGQVPHVTDAQVSKAANWWSRHAEDCPTAAELERGGAR